LTPKFPAAHVGVGDPATRFGPASLGPADVRWSAIQRLMQRDLSAILALGECFYQDMSWQAGLGLLIATALVIGGAVGIGLPLAFVIIWLCS
jgi:hypothetical protein